MAIYTKYLRSKKSDYVKEQVEAHLVSEDQCKFDVFSSEAKKVFLTSPKFRKKSHVYNMKIFEEIYQTNNYQIINVDKYKLEQLKKIILDASIVVSFTSIVDIVLFKDTKSKGILLDDKIVPNTSILNFAVQNNVDVVFVDIGLHIYPIKEDFGPYYLWPTSSFKLYCDDYNLIYDGFLKYDSALLRKSFRRFYRCYKKYYGIRGYVDESQFQYKWLFFEAVKDSWEELKPNNSTNMHVVRIKNLLGNFVIVRYLYNKIKRINL